MNRVVALGIVGWIAFTALGGCQGADPFDRPSDGTGGGGGRIVTGNGGRVVTGNGGSGAGGRTNGAGGSAAGGSGMGGRATGGNGAGGRATGGAGGVGSGGVGAGGSNVGGRGMGGTGAGGRVVDAGANCVSAIQAANYSAVGAPACSACMENGNSKAADCMMMIDCMVGCYRMNNCELDCQHAVSGSSPLVACVDALLMAGGCQ